jgi:hypothetical protein
MSEAAAAKRPVRGAKGRWSVLLGIASMAIGIAAVWVFAAVPKSAPDATRTASTLVFMAAVVVVPLCQMAGFGLGLAAMFSANDRRGLGLLGLVLNGVFVLAVVVFLYAWVASFGAFR